MILEKPLFPTMFYEIDIDANLALAVLNEIKEKKHHIDTVSEATQPKPVSDYSTDYTNRVPIETFDNEVISFLQNEWSQFNIRMEKIESWVSCYTGPNANHPMHNHHATGYQYRSSYSAILYLTSVGTTDFFSVTPPASQSFYSHSSRLGNVVFFPTIIPHQYYNNNYDGNERYVLPFNCDLVQIQ